MTTLLRRIPALTITSLSVPPLHLLNPFFFRDRFFVRIDAGRFRAVASQYARAATSNVDPGEMETNVCTTVPAAARMNRDGVSP